MKAFLTRMFLGFFGLILACTALPGVSRSAEQTAPALAYDSTLNRYLSVWAERGNPNSTDWVIKGQFRDKNGNLIGTSRDLSGIRPKRGCFYETFYTNYSWVSPAPKDCMEVANPTVAYNGGKFLVAWELKGNTMLAKDSARFGGAINPRWGRFSVIIAKLFNADLSDASPEWQEGIVISLGEKSGLYLFSYNTPTPSSKDPNEIMAWSESLHPSIAPAGPDGFLVTWDTNSDYLGCEDPNRRDASSIYARYISPTFSETDPSKNPLSFQVYSNMTGSCRSPGETDRAQKPQVTLNSATSSGTKSQLVIAFQVAKADVASGRDLIAAKAITFDSATNTAVVGPNSASILDIIAKGGSFGNPGVASLDSQVIVAYDDTTNVFIQKIDAQLLTMMAGPLALPAEMGNEMPRIEPAVSANTGGIAISYRWGNDLFRTKLLDKALVGLKDSVVISPTNTTQNRKGKIATDGTDFVEVWQGNPKNNTAKVFGYRLPLMGDLPPTPINLYPDPDLNPESNAVWAPLRLALEWENSTSLDGKPLVYDIYFSQGTLPASPILYKTGYNGSTKFIIETTSDSLSQYLPDTGMPSGLSSNRNYLWRICARSGSSSPNCSEPRAFKTDDSIVGWWRFDDDPRMLDACPGAPMGMQTVCDYSGKNNHGQPSAAGLTRVLPMPGLLGGALSFDGTSGNVSVADSSLLDLSDVSIESWVSPTVIGSTRTIALKGSLDDVPNISYGLYVVPTETVFVIKNGDQVKGPVLPTGKRTHLVGTLGNRELKMYFDGTSVATNSTALIPTVTTSPLSLGSNPNNSRYWSGAIDEIILYNRPLSSQEVGNHFQAGK